MSPHDIVHLCLEALSGAWTPEAEVVAFVRRHARRTAPVTAIVTTLDLLHAQGRAERRRFPGYRLDHWRKPMEKAP